MKGVLTVSFSFERRKDFRHEFYDDTKIEFTVDLSDKEIFEGVVINMSASGLCLLVTSTCLNIGQEIFIKAGIDLASQSARVEWIEEIREGHYKVGLTFEK